MLAESLGRPKKNLPKTFLLKINFYFIFLILLKALSTSLSLEPSFLKINSLDTPYDGNNLFKILTCNVSLDFPVQKPNVSIPDVPESAVPEMEVSGNAENSKTYQSLPSTTFNETTLNETNINSSLDYEDPGTPPPNLSPVRTDPTDMPSGNIETGKSNQSEGGNKSTLEAKCPECEIIFTDSQIVEMIKHIRDDHGKSALIRWRIVPREILPLQCKYCEYTFKSESVLTKHRTEKYGKEGKITKCEQFAKQVRKFRKKERKLKAKATSEMLQNSESDKGNLKNLEKSVNSL